MEAFNVPTRQSIFAILIIVQKYIRILISQIWVLAIAFFIGGKGKWLQISSMAAILVFVAITGTLAIIAYYRYFFYLKNNELVIEKGVFSKTKLNIPFDRIQTINFKQTPLHRLFNVVKVEIDTAGSAKSELALDALTKEDANQLREIILKQKKALDITTQTIDGIEEVAEKKEQILSLNILDLLKVGVSQNHIKSGGIIIGFMWYILSQVDDVGVNVEDIIVDFVRRMEFPGFMTVIIIGGLVMVAAFIISLVRTVIQNFGLKLWREDNKYKVVSGLLTRKEVAATDNKIQIIEWSDNPLKRYFKYFDLRLKQASSQQVSAKKSILIPGCKTEHIDKLKADWLGDTEIANLEHVRVSKHYFRRRLLYSMVFAVLVTVAVYFVQRPYVWVAALLIPFLALTAWLAYKKRRYAFNKDVLMISKGVFGNWYAIMPLYKIQSTIIRQTPYEWRRDLSSLDVVTASGRMTIPFVPLETAKKIQDYFLYRVESDGRDWM